MTADGSEEEEELPLEVFIRQAHQTDPIPRLEQLYAETPSNLRDRIQEKTLWEVIGLRHSPFRPKVIDWVLKKWPRLCFNQDASGSLPAHFLPFIQGVWLSTIRYVIEQNPDSLMQRNASFQDTPLLFLLGLIGRVKCDMVAAVAAMLITPQTAAMGHGAALPLHLATNNLDFSNDVHKFIWKRLWLANPNAFCTPRQDGVTPQDIAFSRQNFDRFLKNLLATPDMNGDLPIHLIAHMKAAGKLYWTWSDQPVRRNQRAYRCWPNHFVHQNIRGEVPLHCFCSQNPECVDVLFSLRDGMLCRDHAGFMPIHRLLEADWTLQEPRKALWILEAFAKMDATYLLQTTPDGDTPLHLARHPALAERIVRYHPRLCTVRNKEDKLPFHCAILNGAGRGQGNGWIDGWLNNAQRSSLPWTKCGTPPLFLACQVDVEETTDKEHGDAAVLSTIYHLVQRSLDLFA